VKEGKKLILIVYLLYALVENNQRIQYFDGIGPYLHNPFSSLFWVKKLKLIKNGH
jgi:hypothetical protein